MRIYDDNWDLRIGEVKIKNSENIQYTLVVGYDLFDKKLYFRLYNNADNFIVGDWLKNIFTMSTMGQMSPEFVKEIEKQILRLEKLKIFA